jgi:lipopolysaccharide biosynthesis protein
LGIEATGRFYDYQHLVADIIAGTERTENPSSAFYRSVMLGWDNSARRSEGWSVWYGFSLDAYYEWLRTVIAYTRNAFPTDQRFVFINAWNEWAEGTYLEPDKRCGYANINTTSRALFDLPREPLPQVLAHSEGRGECNPGTIAVHAHIYFEDVADELLRYINNIPYPFDLYITTDTSGKRDLIRQKFEKDGRQASLAVIQTANVGRDIAPLLVALGRKLANYDYIGHFHTKKSTTVDWGDRWRRYLLDNLLGSSSSVRAVFQEFGRARQVGLIYPPTYPLVAPHADWGGMKERCRALLSEIGADIWLPERPRFPAGNMFWARTAAIRSILGRTWHYDQFEAEEGQVENTTAHCVERLWRYIASSAGYETREALLRDRALKVAMAASYRRLTIFSHYDKRNVISDSDIFYVKSLKDAESDVVFVSNCELSSEQRASVTPYVESLLQRSNVGFDFSAWRDCIDTIGWTRLRAYDELVLANNSCYGPIFPLREMFAAMTDRCCDFWAITGFPSLRNSPRAEASLLPGRNIPLHLQSYFMAFRKSVLRSDAFARFWSQVEDQVDLIAVVAQYESQLTRILSEAGFRWDCYLPETFVMQERNTRDPEFNATYCQPAETILMRAPFVKKKAAMYAPDQIDKATKLIRRFGYYPGSLALWGCG